VSTATRRDTVDLESNRPLGIRRRGPLQGWPPFQADARRDPGLDASMQAHAPAGTDSSGSPAAMRGTWSVHPFQFSQRTRASGTRVAHRLKMTFRRVAGLWLIFAALVGTGCAGRHRLSTGRTLILHSSGVKSGFAEEAGTTGRKDRAAAVGSSFRETKAADAALPPQLQPDSAVSRPPRERAVGTSGDWVVTAITQRPDGPVAATSTQAVNMAGARTSQGLSLKATIHLALAVLVLVICLVVIARVAYSSRGA
jgi:hypothetical protein